MSAETLRKAAALMRERASAAAGLLAADDCYWYEPAELSTALSGAVVATDEQAASDSQHIASWHPAVALAVADLLDCAAAHQVMFVPIRPHLLAIARAYLVENS